MQQWCYCYRISLLWTLLGQVLIGEVSSFQECCYKESSTISYTLTIKAVDSVYLYLGNYTHRDTTLCMYTQCAAHHWHVVVADNLGNRLSGRRAPCTHHGDVLGLSVSQFAEKLPQGCDTITLHDSRHLSFCIINYLIYAGGCMEDNNHRHLE